MRFIGEVTPINPRWKKWREEAVAKKNAMVAAWRANEPFEIEEHYSHKAAKDELLSIFGGKCSYCEIRLEGAQFGDVEHYRPKGGVRDTDNKPVVDPMGKPHRGYFWLAYEWINLLISCAACNKVKIGRNGVKYGKGERFPLEGGERSFTPDDGVAEQPTLLNPWVDDPAKHLKFDASGTISWDTERGRRNVELLGLNRDGLLESRKETCSNVKGMYLRLMGAMVDENAAAFDELMNEIDAHRAGKRPFSATTAELIRKLDKGLEKVLKTTRVA